MRPVDSLPVLIFDLDGTILRTNSFPLWVVYLAIGRIPELELRQRVSLSMQTMRLLLSRKIGQLGHDELQRRLQLVWQAAIAGGRLPMTNRYEDRLLRRVRPNLGALLHLMVERQFDAVLATAAAADYAEPLGRRLGFEHVLATRTDRIAGEPANAGASKRRSVGDFLRQAGWCERSLILFTDHLDDLPLSLDCDVVCWFGSAGRLAKARAMAGKSGFVHCRDMSPEMLQATVLGLCDYTAHSPAPRPMGPLSEITVS
jgi:phosphoserine phosphatase